MSKHAIVLPILPADDIRTAVASGDWTRAGALVAGHDATVRAAFVDPPKEDARTAMIDLLAATRDPVAASALEKFSANESQGEAVRDAARYALAQM